MNDIVKGTDSKTRVLVASIASASDVIALASQVMPEPSNSCSNFSGRPNSALQGMAC